MVFRENQDIKPSTLLIMILNGSPRIHSNLHFIGQSSPNFSPQPRPPPRIASGEAGSFSTAEPPAAIIPKVAYRSPDSKRSAIDQRGFARTEPGGHLAQHLEHMGIGMIVRWRERLLPQAEVFQNEIGDG